MILPPGGFFGHHIWVSSDADGLERAQSHFLAGEILPTYVSICRAPVVLFVLPFPSRGLSKSWLPAQLCSVCGASLQGSFVQGWKWGQFSACPEILRG